MTKIFMIIISNQLRNDNDVLYGMLFKGLWQQLLEIL